eukprot:9597890-Karenia_brevis.AAC.1
MQKAMPNPTPEEAAMLMRVMEHRFVPSKIVKMVSLFSTSAMDSWTVQMKHVRGPGVVDQGQHLYATGHHMR